uniref:Uncharacterized protein n=1 Tax=Desulfobacca acetoxidans TaxID=60893 RepID=A0A7V4LC84_9BACT
MTQALAAYDAHGLIMATDSRGTRFSADRQVEVISVKKLLPLGRFTALLSGGAGVSVSLGEGLRQQIERLRGLEDLDQIVEYALTFLSQGYARHLERYGPEPEGFRRVYFILGGYSPHYPPPGYKLYLLGSEENELPLRLLPVTNLVVMPRNLGLEMQLAKLLHTDPPLSELLALSKTFLEKQAAAKEEVGPPFYFATITPEGYRAVEV